MPLTRRSLVAAFALSLSFAAPALADTALDAPTGETILTVSGAIQHRNDGDTARFDLAMLEAMPAVTIETSTIWTDGVQSFTGVSLKDLLDRLGAEGGTIAASALNDYTVEIPVSDAVEGGPILAYAMNGKALSVRDKGPLWVVYPYDSKSEYQTEVIYSRSIWQLAKIDVRP
ncbi:MAG: hypothetical protein RIR62_308 [Pseudomonadota bacterium]